MDMWYHLLQINTLRPEQDDRSLTDCIFKYIFLKKPKHLPYISLNFICKGPIDNESTGIRVMACRYYPNQWWFCLVMYTCVARASIYIPPKSRVKSRSLEIGCYNDRIALKLDRHLDSIAAEVPGKFQSDWISLKPNLAPSRLHEILR